MHEMWRYVWFCIVFINLEAHYNDDFDLKNYYYDVKTKRPFRVISIQNSLSEQLDESKKHVIRRIAFRSNGCTCLELTCGCCLGFDFQQFNFKREGCMNFTYDPQNFAITMNMLMNGDSVFSNTLSARNPPPICIPIPIPYIPASIDFCTKLYDIHTPGQRLHMCLDMETRIEKATVLILHFDCMIMGQDGVSHLKPGESEEVYISSTTSTDSQVDSDVFDEVNETTYAKNSTANQNLFT